MSSSTAPATAPLPEPSRTTNWSGEVFISPWLWGPALTAGFYLLIPFLPRHGELLARYFCNHPVAYCETTLFFLGVAVLLSKTFGLVQDRRALKLIMIDGDSLDGIDSPADRARSMLSAVAGVPVTMHRTRLVTRIREVCEYVAGRGPAAALEEHLRYLADLAVESLSSSFALVRTITWMVPVLGGLGTVIGIASAIRGIDAGNPGASIAAVVSSVALALDPLVLALGMSLILAFAKFLVERGEGSVLASVEQFGIGQIAPCFNLEHPDGVAPLAAAEAKSAEQLVERTEALINWQTGLWQTALENLRTRWIETAEAQQTQFAAALQKGMAGSLAGHSQQLEEARGEFLKGFRSVGQELLRVTAGLQQMGEEHQNLFHAQVTEIWRTIEGEMNAARADHEAQISRSVALLDTAVHSWHEDLAKATAAMTAQLQELRQHGETLRGVAGQEEELVRLQTTLTHNLQTVRAVEAFEESIHSLNAAVHMLTIRAKAHAA